MKTTTYKPTFKQYYEKVAVTSLFDNQDFIERFNSNFKYNERYDARNYMLNIFTTFYYRKIFSDTFKNNTTKTNDFDTKLYTFNIRYFMKSIGISNHKHNLLKKVIDFMCSEDVIKLENAHKVGKSSRMYSFNESLIKERFSSYGKEQYSHL